MTTSRTPVHSLQVATELHRFIEQEVLPGTGVASAAFWRGFNDAELSALVERALALLRERHAAQLLPALTTVCIDICRNPPRATGELLNLACLVRRHDQQAFDDELSRAASGFDDDVTFEISGPWAPHHFCSIHPLAFGQQVEHAQVLLAVLGVALPVLHRTI